MQEVKNAANLPYYYVDQQYAAVVKTVDACNVHTTASDTAVLQ
jgi:hypothetical protein